jgi:hypothetical protein
MHSIYFQMGILCDFYVIGLNVYLFQIIIRCCKNYHTSHVHYIDPETVFPYVRSGTVTVKSCGSK